MIEYGEVKDFLCRAVGKRDREQDDYNIIVDFGRGRYSTAQIAEEPQVLILDEDLLDLYNRTNSMQHDGVVLYAPTHYEVAIELDYPMMRNRDIAATIDDITNGLNYEMSLPSAEYNLFSIISIMELRKNQGIRRNLAPILSRIRRQFDYRFNTEDAKEMSFRDIISKMIGTNSLRITSDAPRQIENFKSLCSAFTFEFMYQTDIALIEHKSAEEIFNINTSPRNRLDISQLDKPPLRVYTDDVVDYYKLALSSNDAYIKYISFYHIAEYFYDEVFRKRLVDDLKDKITHPSFSYKNDEKIYEMALFVKNRLKMNTQDGQGNELESLKFVLAEFVSIEDLKNRINAMSDSALTYYQTTKVPFCSAAVISWNDSQGVLTQIAKRIYYTRNSLVHSKSGQSNERYRPYENEKELRLEIPLVKAIAESIVINSSRAL